MMPFSPRAARGFSLVELAIVLIIVTLLSGGMMMTLSAQQEVAQLRETQGQLEAVKEALVGFALANGRLPCPARPTVARGTAGAGSEDCALEHGVVPWAALGLPETDPWGRRLTYYARNDFTDALGSATWGGCAPSPTPTQASFALCSNGTAMIQDGTGNNLAADLPAVIVAHGADGAGAYLPTGIQIGGAAGDEAENANADLIFVYRTPSPDYDDLVTWIAPTILKSRMVYAGRLP